MTTRKPQPLWANDNGAITCETHAGAYLRAGIESDRIARQHPTPLGTWRRLPDTERHRLNREFGPILCETCHWEYGSRRRTSDVDATVDLDVDDQQTDPTPNPQPEGSNNMSNETTVTEEVTPRSETPKQEQQRDRDRLAWEKYLHLGSWVKVAELLAYANGSCARRAGMRHATRNNLVVQEKAGSPAA